MDQNELQNSIRERFDNLQPEIQNIIMDPLYDKKIFDIGQKYKLTNDQLKKFELGTTLVLLGEVHPDLYKKELAENLQLPVEIIGNIARDVNEQILKNVIDVIKQNFTDDETPEVISEKSNLDPAFSELPQTVKDAIIKSDYQKKLYAIGTKHKLQVERMGALEKVTIKFIAGKLSSSQYENELALETDLPADKVREIATDVNEDVMKSIRGNLQNKPIVKLEEDEVPLPPYAQKMQTPVVPQKEENIYEKAGIDVIPEARMPVDDERQVTIKEDKILVGSGISMIEEEPHNEKEHLIPNNETEKSVLEGIEHPVNVASSIIGDKLTKMITSKNSVSDYSLPKINSTTPPVNPPKIQSSLSHDPYHEAVE